MDASTAPYIILPPCLFIIILLAPFIIPPPPRRRFLFSSHSLPFSFSLSLSLSLPLPLSLFLPPSLFSCCLSHSLSPSLTRTIEPCHGLYSAVSLSSFLFPFPFFFLVLSPSLLPPFFPSLSRWFLYLPLISRLFRREIRFMVHWQDRVTCSYGYTRLFIYTYTCTYQGPVDIL